MNIKRYFARNAREAMSMVRRELGDAAIILSNRQLADGVEIMAFREQDMQAMIEQEPTPAAQVALSSRSAEGLLDMLNGRRPAAEPVIKPNKSAPRQPAEQRRAPELQAELQQAPAWKAPQPPQAASRAQPEMLGMMDEIRQMRSVIQTQLAEIAWANTQQREPMKASLLNRMLSAGFSPVLSRQITEKLPAYRTFAEVTKWADSVLGKNIQTLTSEDRMLDEGGVFAMIGPTGVGKTTTTAKMAARFVMRHGAGKLGLITTDGYRVGGHEQLRIYGKILGVMVHAVKDQADLEIALKELSHKHTILIDTVGVSQKDRMVAEQVAMLSSSRIKKLLCLNATSTTATLTDVVSAYRGRGLDGCIVTKLDEAATLGSVLDVIIREKLKLYYVANGQRVPEDLHLANKQLLIHRAFKLGASNNGLLQHHAADLPMLMANSLQSSAAAKPRMHKEPHHA